MRTLWRIIARKIKEKKELYELNKYDRFTIAAHFRKQGAQVGEGCSIIPNSIGVEPYLVKIGNHVTIANGVKFITHDGAAWLFRDQVADLQVFGPIIIEDNCVVGENAILMPNARIGRNSIVGAGSVVINAIPANSIAFGVPARVIGSIDRYGEKCIERWNIQRPNDVVIEEGATWWNSKHHAENVLKLKNHLLKIFAPVLFEQNQTKAETDGRLLKLQHTHN
jgi:acetyltransferase-like isoleucine patch superfamily enzyme